ncbi:MAG: DUF6950 family protein [Mesorhizobium sp.]
MNRLPDWNARLHAYVDAVKRRPFDWVGHDCAAGFVAGAVEAMTGEDIAAGYRGRYRTERGALGVMKRAGFTNLADVAASKLPEIHISQARMGDVAAIPTDTPFGFVLGIVNGEMILALRPDGVGLAPLLSATRAFRV